MGASEKREHMDCSWGGGGGVSELALGVVYMAAGRDPVSVEWNRLLIEKLDREIELLQEQGKDIMLVGDFNDHIGDRHRVAPDRQGREVKAAWARWGMEMVNRSKEGNWEMDSDERGSKVRNRLCSNPGGVRAQDRWVDNTREWGVRNGIQ